jgi:sugar/nucleoside kinase (ribokinase family)
MYDVVTTGILVADVLCKTVDAIPERGKLGLIRSMRLYNGGGAMSAAIGLAKLGAKTAIIGKVGDDGFGQFLTGVLAQNGVNTGALVADAKVDTSASVVLVDSGGERTFLHCQGSNGAFRETDIDYGTAEKANIFFLSGSMLLGALDGEPTAAALKKVKALGKTTVLDTAWDDTGRWMELLAPCLPYVDYFAPSIEEAEKFSGETTPEKIADVFFDCGVSHVVIKLGKKGCYFRETKDAEGVFVPAYPVENAADTTGAGDSFCAGFLFGLSRGMGMLESCKLGAAVGAHCVQAVGATTGIPPYETVQKFMKEREIQ